MLSGEEPPDAGQRVEGHNVVMQYFAQDEANRLEPALTVHETLAAGSPLHMVPMIRNILGGFLFSGDDVYKKVRVLSGGERTRLGVARMLLRPSNALLLDEPTNHLDLDSKEVLLDALVDYGGTLIFVSHDRYFVERLATKIIEIGHGTATVYPGTYKEFLWHKEHREATTGGLERREGLDRQERESWRTKTGCDVPPKGRARHDLNAIDTRRRSRPIVRHNQRLNRPARIGSAPTPRRERNLARSRRSARRSMRSKRKLRRPKMPFAISSNEWPPRGSTTTARPPNRSSTNIRP